LRLEYPPGEQQSVDFLLLQDYLFFKVVVVAGFLVLHSRLEQVHRLQEFGAEHNQLNTVQFMLLNSKEVVELGVVNLQGPLHCLMDSLTQFNLIQGLAAYSELATPLAVEHAPQLQLVGTALAFAFGYAQFETDAFLIKHRLVERHIRP